MKEVSRKLFEVYIPTLKLRDVCPFYFFLIYDIRYDGGNTVFPNLNTNYEQ